MKKIKAGFLVVLVVLLPLGASAGLKDKLKRKSPPPTATAGSLVKAEYREGIKFTLTDQEVEAAIAWGKAHKQAELMNPYQGVCGGGWGEFSDDLGALVPKAVVTTKYYQIAAYSQEQTSKYLELDPRKIEEIRNYADLMIGFTATSAYPDFPKNLHAVLKQGDKVIQPKSIQGKDEPAKADGYSSTWFNVFTAFFPIAEIDPQAKSFLIIIDPVRNREQKIGLDFARMK